MLPRALRDGLVWSDAVLADFPFCAPVFRAPQARRKLRILSTHNVEHKMLGRGPNGWPSVWSALVRRVELGAAKSCDLLVSCSAEDARFFETQVRVRLSVVVPNGTDAGRFCGTTAERADTRRRLGLSNTVRVFLFTGSKWGPNHEAFSYLLDFARQRAELLARQEVHILVVGGVSAEAVRVPGFTATGPVDAVEPYFAAADAAVNPLQGGGGTNVKMGEFIAARLPILTTPFGARGYHIADGESGFMFEREGLADALTRVRCLFDENPAALRRIALAAWRENQELVDMDLCVRPLVGALRAWQDRFRGEVPESVPPGGWTGPWEEPG